LLRDTLDDAPLILSTGVALDKVDAPLIEKGALSVEADTDAAPLMLSGATLLAGIAFPSISLWEDVGGEVEEDGAADFGSRGGLAFVASSTLPGYDEEPVVEAGKVLSLHLALPFEVAAEPEASACKPRDSKGTFLSSLLIGSIKTSSLPLLRVSLRRGLGGVLDLSRPSLPSMTLRLEPCTNSGERERDRETSSHRRLRGMSSGSESSAGVSYYSNDERLVRDIDFLRSHLDNAIVNEEILVRRPDIRVYLYLVTKL
jgi:hypothetical protein